MGSNRTFMELKYRTYRGNAMTPKRSNRTFMELKYRFCAIADTQDRF